MMTLRLLASLPADVPSTVAWALADVGEARGRQELFTRQSPQRLKVLREHALIESAVSSNRIEGVTVDQDRVRSVVMGKARLQNRDEEEVRGYRDALRLIHERHAKLPISEKTIRELHRLSRGKLGDAGNYRAGESVIVEVQPNGRRRVRFKAVEPDRVRPSIAEMVTLWDRCVTERWVHPLVGLAASNLDFLCIHPFRDGNGRVSRLLWLLQSYHLGYEVGRYISLERLVEEHKDRYYETLEPRTKFAWLARWPSRSMAVHQFRSVRLQDCLQGVRGTSRTNVCSSRRKDGTCHSNDPEGTRDISRGRPPTRVPWRQSRPDPRHPEKAAGSGSGRVSWARSVG
jgi:Fic family protein